MDAMQISLSGLDVEWRRLQVIAQNLANINTTRTADGGSYQPMRLVSGPDVSFETLVQTGGQMPDEARGVQVFGIEATGDGLRATLDPDHPHADEDGMVFYPDIDHAAEMTLMIKTSRVYEANLTAISIAQQMYTSALEMGR